MYRIKYPLAFVFAIFAFTACTERESPLEIPIQFADACASVDGGNTFYCETFESCASLGGSWHVNADGYAACISNGSGGGGGGGGWTPYDGGNSGGSGSGGYSPPPGPPPGTDPEPDESTTPCDSYIPSTASTELTSMACTEGDPLFPFMIKGDVFVGCPPGVNTSGRSVVSANSTGVTWISVTRVSEVRWTFKAGVWFQNAYYKGTARAASDGSTHSVEGRVWCKVGWGIFAPLTVIEP